MYLYLCIQHHFFHKIEAYNIITLNFSTNIILLWVFRYINFTVSWVSSNSYSLCCSTVQQEYIILLSTVNVGNLIVWMFVCIQIDTVVSSVRIPFYLDAKFIAILT